METETVLFNLCDMKGYAKEKFILRIIKLRYVELNGNKITLRANKQSMLKLLYAIQEINNNSLRTKLVEVNEATFRKAISITLTSYDKVPVIIKSLRSHYAHIIDPYINLTGISVGK